MRLLCIDYGLRRMGLAVCDPTEIAVTGLPNLEWDGIDLEPVWDRLQGILDGYREDAPVGRLVVGLPLRADGTEGDAAARIRRFVAELERRLGLPVDTFDERHTTEDARAALRDTRWSGKRKKAKLDVMAAILILRGYLDSKRGEEPR